MATSSICKLLKWPATGFKDAEHLKTDDDLKAQRGRDDFKKLVAELEKSKQ